MTDSPFMPKATAVWLVENTTLTFKQIAEFCKLHELEVKGIADGDVAKGIKAYNPILAGQLSREEIVVRTAAQRLRPIILTTATTVIGLLPLASGIGVDFYQRNIEIGGRVSEWWQPMSFAVVSGLTFASAITLFLTPCWLMLPVAIRNTFNNIKNTFTKTASER